MNDFVFESLVSLFLRLLPGELVRGEPYAVGAKTFIPVAQIREISAFGGRLRFRSIEPAEIIEDSGSMCQTFKVSRPPLELAARLAALSVPVLLFVAVSIWRRQSGCRGVADRADR